MPESRADIVIERKKESFAWLENNFYPEWEQTFKNYKLERDPEKDDDGKEDPEQTSIGMPDTWGYARRTVARGTAQPPNLRFHAKDSEISELITRTLMYQWDKAKMQRTQKKHFLQAVLFGWSVKAWHWAVEDRVRTRRVDIEKIDPVTLEQISQTYNVPTRYLQMDPELTNRILSRLLAKHGRAGLLPVKYVYKSYEGPKSDFVFVGDCFPEPDFQTLQSSNWLIVERRRNKQWLERVAQAYPQFKDGFNELVTKYKNGTEPPSLTSDQRRLRNRLQAAIDRTEPQNIEAQRSPEWTITEMHVPGEEQQLTYVGEEDIFIGKIPYPYELEGQIAFTECVLIDDLLSGIGDSTARVLRGLQLLHERQVNRRFDLIWNILRPLLGTSNRALYEDPGLIKRGKGFRLVYMRGQGDLWVQPEQGAIAAAAASMQDEGGIMRLYQLLTGESNMSMMANVDPSQARTATGARLMAFNQDVLTKDLNDAFTQTSLNADGEMMYLLNRSELNEGFEFESSRYNRRFSTEEEAFKQKWLQVEPIHFQTDGEIVAEAGSTLADDDDTRVNKANNLYSMFGGNPTVNQEKLRDNTLIAYGEGRSLPQWAAPPPPPPPPPEIKTTMTVSAKWAELSDEERAAILQRANIQLQPEGMPGGPSSPSGPPGAQGPIPIAPPGARPPGAPPLPTGPPELAAAQALMAARGSSPLRKP